MATPNVEHRVSQLEELFAAFLRAQEKSQHEIYELARDLRELKLEMIDFKEEMRGFKNEMLAFKDEMRAFKDEMRDFKRDSRKQWGELANALGRVAEDLVAPGVSSILSRMTGCAGQREQSSAVRVRRHPPGKPSELREFDVVAVCDDWAIVVEVRTRLQPADVPDFVTLMTGVREFFPELGDKKLVGAVGTLYPDPSIVTQGGRAGIAVLGMGDDLLEVHNPEGFQPRLF